MEDRVEGPPLATGQHLVASSLQKPWIKKSPAKSLAIKKKNQNKIFDLNYSISEAITNT